MSRWGVRVAAAFVLLVALVAGYRWWTSPERQIRAILSDVAGAFTYEHPGSGLETLAAVAALKKHLAADVALEGAADTRIAGRDEAITAAARLRTATPMMRVRFFDPRITLRGDSRAAVSVTAEVTTRTDAGEDVVDVQQVQADLEQMERRWMVTSARTAVDEEPQS